MATINVIPSSGWLKFPGLNPALHPLHQLQSQIYLSASRGYPAAAIVRSLYHTSEKVSVSNFRKINCVYRYFKLCLKCQNRPKNLKFFLPRVIFIVVGESDVRFYKNFSIKPVCALSSIFGTFAMTHPITLKLYQNIENIILKKITQKIGNYIGHFAKIVFSKVL